MKKQKPSVERRKSREDFRALKAEVAQGFQELKAALQETKTLDETQRERLREKVLKLAQERFKRAKLTFMKVVITSFLFLE